MIEFFRRFFEKLNSDGLVKPDSRSYTDFAMRGVFPRRGVGKTGTSNETEALEKTFFWKGSFRFGRRRTGLSRHNYGVIGLQHQILTDILVVHDFFVIDPVDFFGPVLVSQQ